ncbi:replication initiator [Streptomyces sp. 900105755]|uniref:replication initiator n=1 Tax=Streptomyces sp. NPDC001507 TaxID=3364579 RepID=UPI0036C8389B
MHRPALRLLRRLRQPRRRRTRRPHPPLPHPLGFRDHFSTKSRRYSTTLGVLRDARAQWRRAQAATATNPQPGTTYVLAHWVFAGTGLSSAETWLAASLEPALGTEGEPTA